jgi:hypothetical protein
MTASSLKWNRTHSAVAGMLAVALVLVVANMFRTTPASADESYDGRVMMSSGDSTLMVQLTPDSDAREFKVATDAKITKDGEKSSLDKLSTGDQVTIAVAVRNSEEIATTIVARSPL